MQVHNHTYTKTQTLIRASNINPTTRPRDQFQAQNTNTASRPLTYKHLQHATLQVPQVNESLTSSNTVSQTSIPPSSYVEPTTTKTMTTSTSSSHQNSSLYHSQLFVKAPLERKSKAQLHKTHWLNRAITAPRLL